MDTDRLLKGKIPCKETGIEVKKSICSICNPLSHCGLDVFVKDEEIIKIQGMKEHANSRGTLCSKGSATRQYVYSPDRIKTPLKRVGEKGSDKFEEITWEEAYATIAKNLNETKKEIGPECAAFFVGYSKWMRPYAQRLAHSYGTPNYCSESSTCAKATVMAFALNYGAAAGPDIANTNCLFVWSSNPFYTNTTLAEIILNKKEKGMKMIVVDPRVTPTASRADIHLQLRPGTDGALALGIAHVIINEQLYDHEFVDNYSVGFDDYKAYVQEFTPERAEEITGVPKDRIIAAARMYATVAPAAFMTSAAPVVQNTNGVQNYRAAMALIGLTGNMDIKGGNVIKKPSYIAATSGFDTRFKEYSLPKKWDEMKPRVGSESVPVWCEINSEAQAVFLPDQILTEKPYPIKSLVGFGLNHRMWPDTKNMIKALEKLDFFVNIDLFFTDACKYADIVLPACTSVERSEFKSYNNGYVIHTLPAIKPLYKSKSDIDIIFDLAKCLDIDDDLLKQGYEANIDWILEPSGLTYQELIQSPNGMFAPNIKPTKYEKYKKVGFNTISGKMEFTSERLAKYSESHGYDSLPTYKPSESSKESTPEIAKDYPFIINTGARLPMFIHSRTFRLPWTKSLRPVPSADINQEDALELGIKQDDDIKLYTPKGEIFVKANISPMILKGVISMYHGYKDANVNLLIDAFYIDPISGFPGFKSFLGNMAKVGDE
jgi:anaerobic selenocysteine-containing dehydrogenase